jgi:hypothetical protein
VGLLTAVPVTAQGVRVAIVPASGIVSPGSEFDVSIDVTQAGSAFNAFDLFVGFDPAALTPVIPTSISDQEGAYFKSGCDSRYHHFLPGTDRDTITDVLLCAGASLTGPGQIYKLRFRASTTQQFTTIRFLPGLQFYNAGLFVNPTISTNATIGIGVGVGIEPVAPRPSRLRITASPNPARRAVSFRIDTDRDGDQSLVVVDAQGRIVRQLQQGRFVPGTRRVAWDGTSDSGLVARPGAYVALLRAPDRTIRARFMLLE